MKDNDNKKQAVSRSPAMICSTARNEETRSAIAEAIDILDYKKLSVVHENLDAWFILCHAKFYLQSQMYQ